LLSPGAGYLFSFVLKKRETRAKPKQDAETGAYLPNGGSAKSGLNKSIRDAGWNQFVQYCTYKAEDAGREVLTVNPRYTSAGMQWLWNHSQEDARRALAFLRMWN